MTLPTGDRAQLERYLQDESPHVRSRAAIVLQGLEGQTPEAIAESVGVSVKTVQKWQKAWEEQGLAIFPEPESAEMAEATSETPADTNETLAVVVEVAAEDDTMIQVEELLAQFERETLILPPHNPVCADDTIASAAQKIMLSQLAELLKHEPMVRAGEDIEGVHKMRVATRRLRSAYNLLGDYLDERYYKKLPSPLKFTAQTLGAVRDLDVFLAHLHEYATKNPSEGIQALLTVVKNHHEAARESLLEWLDEARYDRFIMRFFNVLTESATDAPVSSRVDHALPAMIYNRLSAVRHYDDLLPEADIETLHSLRIEFKRLRYTLEFFEEALGRSVKKVIEEIKLMQDHLGLLNDAVVAEAMLRDFQKEVPKELREAVREYRQVRQTEGNAFYENFPAAWERFNRREVREAIAMAVAVL